MKTPTMLAEELLERPYNWAGLTASELIEAERLTRGAAISGVIDSVQSLEESELFELLGGEINFDDFLSFIDALRLALEEKL